MYLKTNFFKLWDNICTLNEQDIQSVFKNDSWFCWYFNIKISLFRQRGSERSYDGVYYDECIYHQC